jgi:hypothetical protein
MHHAMQPSRCFKLLLIERQPPMHISSPSELIAIFLIAKANTAIGKSVKRCYNIWGQVRVEWYWREGSLLCRDAGSLRGKKGTMLD